jgi:uncharacterized membrane protein
MNITEQIPLPSRRQVRRVLRQLPIRSFGRTRRAVGDSRFWAGIGLGLGVGGALSALTNPRTGAETRARLRSRLQGLGESVRGTSSRAASQIEESIVIEVPARVAYNQWTQFEEFPRFMQGVSDVEQIDDRRLHWKAEIAGQAREWDAEICEQIPDRRIAWKSFGGPTEGGAVTFHRLSDDSCKLMLQMNYSPNGAAEQLGEALGVVRRRIRGDLDRFRDFVEERGSATGAFRGRVSQSA